MRFYVTGTGEVFHRQDEAKKADKHYKTIELATDQKSLISLFNEKKVFAPAGSQEVISVSAAEFIETQDIPKPAKFRDDVVGQFITQGEVDKINSQRGPCGPLTAHQIEDMRHRQGNCPKCGTNPAMRASHELAAVEEFIEKADDTYLTHVEVACQMKREDMAMKEQREAEALAAPKPVRVRVRTKA